MPTQFGTKITCTCGENDVVSKLAGAEMIVATTRAGTVHHRASHSFESDVQIKGRSTRRSDLHLTLTIAALNLAIVTIDACRFPASRFPTSIDALK